MTCKSFVCIIIIYCNCTCILAIAVGNIYVPNLASPVIMVYLILLRKRKKDNRNKYVLSCISLQAFVYRILSQRHDVVRV